MIRPGGDPLDLSCRHSARRLADTSVDRPDAVSRSVAGAGACWQPASHSLTTRAGLAYLPEPQRLLNGADVAPGTMATIRYAALVFLILPPTLLFGALFPQSQGFLRRFDGREDAGRQGLRDEHDGGASRERRSPVSWRSRRSAPTGCCLPWLRWPPLRRWSRSGRTTVASRKVQLGSRSSGGGRRLRVSRHRLSATGSPPSAMIIIRNRETFRNTFSSGRAGRASSGCCPMTETR